MFEVLVGDREGKIGDLIELLKTVLNTELIGREERQLFLLLLRNCARRERIKRFLFLSSSIFSLPLFTLFFTLSKERSKCEKEQVNDSRTEGIPGTEMRSRMRERENEEKEKMRGETNEKSKSHRQNGCLFTVSLFLSLVVFSSLPFFSSLLPLFLSFNSFLLSKFRNEWMMNTYSLHSSCSGVNVLLKRSL